MRENLKKLLGKLMIGIQTESLEICWKTNPQINKSPSGENPGGARLGMSVRILEEIPGVISEVNSIQFSESIVGRFFSRNVTIYRKVFSLNRWSNSWKKIMKKIKKNGGEIFESIPSGFFEGIHREITVIAVSRRYRQIFW